MSKIQELGSKIQNILSEAQEQFSKAEDSHSLYQQKVKYLGRQGNLTLLMKEMHGLPKEDRPLFGEKINKIKNQINSLYEEKSIKLKEKEQSLQMSKSELDLSLPGPEFSQGAFHPIEQVMRKTINIFENLGYIQNSGPLIETDWYNFSALNIPPDHPSRDNHDTFFLDSKHLLRTHTSPVQIRSLEKLKPPMAIIAPGPVFRRDELDASHSPFFHQIEGLFIDRHVSMSHLKGTLSYFVKKLHGSSIQVRFRPSFFPFTEPSAEYDCSCFLCENRGCSLCKKSGWIEMGGSGLVHPEVLRASGVNPDKWQGFAFGMGIDRLTLLEYGIPDIRFLYENKMEFLSQFK